MNDLDLQFGHGIIEEVREGEMLTPEPEEEYCPICFNAGVIPNGLDYTGSVKDCPNCQPDDIHDTERPIV